MALCVDISSLVGSYNSSLVGRLSYFREEAIIARIPVRSSVIGSHSAFRGEDIDQSQSHVVNVGLRWVFHPGVARAAGTSVVRHQAIGSDTETRQGMSFH